MKKLSNKKIKRIKELRRKGYSISIIAFMTKLAPSTVFKYCKHIRTAINGKKLRKHKELRGEFTSIIDIRKIENREVFREGVTVGVLVCVALVFIIIDLLILI